MYAFQVYVVEADDERLPVMLRLPIGTAVVELHLDAAVEARLGLNNFCRCGRLVFCKTLGSPDVKVSTADPLHSYLPIFFGVSKRSEAVVIGRKNRGLECQQSPAQASPMSTSRPRDNLSTHRGF